MSLVKKGCILIFLMLGLTVYPLSGWACPTHTRSCPAGGDKKCVGSGTSAECWANCTKGSTGDCDTSCTEKAYLCNCGEYKCSICCASCTPPSCPRSNWSNDADGDGYTDQDICSCAPDCAWRNDQTPGKTPKLVNPGRTNPFCDCKDTDTYKSTVGLAENLNCVCTKIDDATANCLEFKEGCFCIDEKDNDCDGLIDADDGDDCPRVGEDWIVMKSFTLKTNKEVNGLYVFSPATLTISSNVTLKVKKDRGVHVHEGAKIEPKSGAKIEFY